MTYKLEPRFPEEISAASDVQMISLSMAECEEELQSLSMRVKGESEKAGLEFNIKTLRSWHPVPSLHGK